MKNFELQNLRDLPIEGVAERLGLSVENHKCLCPFHDDHRASLKFKNNKYKCWSCGESGGTIDLVMKYLNKDFKEACEWLGRPSPNLLPSVAYAPQLLCCQRAIALYGEASSNLSSPLRGGVRGGLFDASRYEKYFERPFLNAEARKFLFEERKLDERVVRWCRLTSWRDRKGVPWLQIPYYNREGKLIGVQNRNLSPLPASPGGRGDPTLQISTRGTMRHLQSACPEPPEAWR